MIIKKIFRFFSRVSILCACAFCMARTSQNNANLNKTVLGVNGYTYERQETGGSLTLTNGKVVKMEFGENSVEIKDVYLYDGAETAEIVCFVRAYAMEQGYSVPRKATELMGEFRLHKLFYKVGYKKSAMRNARLEYKKDGRWYVNVASKIVGWCGA